MEHKAGFVNIIGNPNAGKSTLMNALVGERLSIITPKAQTTRHRIMGIVNGEDFQIIFSDTPGILKTHYLLQDSMMKTVNNAIHDADLILYIVDINDNEIDESIIEKIKNSDTPVVLLINKIDLSNQEELEKKMIFWKEKLEKAFVIQVSALLKFNIKNVLNKILFYLPEHPEYFSKDELTDKPMRFFVSEIIREKIFKFYDKEIPYCCEVVVDSFKDESSIVKIRAGIFVARESQKGIIIGHQGKALKKIGTEARKDIEAFLGKKVFLETVVKVSKEWRNNEGLLKQFGYNI